ncbi:hypothetical protein [Modestobacter italicus]|uniref:hypothetical protein n=1 Tax=Modestobacter italicus (strain DSM 44449 / CECT 9708 / BC 501) TaxID=2732864 RepID=UPI0006878FE1|nr:hypothetical protein [Modestobacter marinus]
MATPFSTMPASSSGTWTGRVLASGSTVSVALMVSPTSTTLPSVPTPGRRRSGAHSSRTTPPVRIDQVPTSRPKVSDRPWSSTLHGISPSPARSISPTLTP